MTEREKDLETIGRYAGFLAMPGDENSTTLAAMARQLAWLVRCGRFVEEHGDALGCRWGDYRASHKARDDYRAALEALASLRSPAKVEP